MKWEMATAIAPHLAGGAGADVVEADMVEPPANSSPAIRTESTFFPASHRLHPSVRTVDGLLRLLVGVISALATGMSRGQ